MDADFPTCQKVPKRYGYLLRGARTLRIPIEGLGPESKIREARCESKTPVDRTTSVEVLFQLLGGGGVVNVADVDAPGIHLHLLLETQVQVDVARRRGGH